MVEQGQQTVEHSPRACDGALARAFGFLGKRWNGILLATLAHGPAGFSDLRRNVAGISDSVLSDRLTELTRAGLVSRTVHDGPPVAVVYELTASGHALAPALQELTTWARENLTEERCRAER
ncbi:DNA-binding HxlR family transcriptional regulator [Kineococcus radiotolerans]|uniref:Transcriptional regulator, HxlR family n=2 Tax=Kineococcus radiotolerans TaxID=131568 RepID=A6WDV8_KINRD|nr:helix-turn-helix domain-containing protein [Kineococcus radiotolerans]ABS04997.1 transcriptional regulator, HxlR family [Kineococcus radiotolerans SRS30216 = ATCC BAA-149]MBB2901842.1 DNA-binding HxlR family transcriptional regulator [Kineococcus radiotolerans]